MNKTRVGFGFMWVLLVTLSLGMTQAQGQPTFRIGVIDEERGALSTGARLAVAEINAAGGVRGAEGTVFLLELVVQPPSEDGNISTAVANIAQAGVIAVLGPVDTEVTLTNLSQLQGLRVPILTPAIGDTILASDSSGLVFRSRATEFVQGRALVTYLAEDLRASNVVTVQLDIASTAGIVGFTTAANALGIPAQRNILFESNMTLADVVNEILSSNPQVAAVYGTPDLAADVLVQLRDSGWTGIFAYNQLESSEFRERVPLALLAGVIGATTWSPGGTDAASQIFVVNYVRATGMAPGAVQAAAYDSVRLMSAAISLPGALEANLAALPNTPGVQGVLRPAELARGETSDNAVVVRLGALGGGQVVARFAGSTRLPLESAGDSPSSGILTPVATAVPTLDGVIVTVTSAVQNVRSGPSRDFEVLGQLQEGDSRQVIGANSSFTWVVIDFRGSQGWLAVDPALNEIIGDRNSVPIIANPPTPTSNPQTLTPPAPPLGTLPDIVIVSASPSEIPANATSTVTVTMRNAGSPAAGPFAVAASYLPNNAFVSQNFSGLAGGAQQTFTFTLTTGSQTGNFETAIVADLNNEVAEGGTGEANNGAFVHRYRIDQPSVTNAISMAPASSVD
ncbi:MAG: ABC transporter substrate-binding protein, partial [Armatimonadetes bacterium]|nr:ABC transporter substrate-binding protein [Anaerolineae bacterium]